MEGDAAKRQLQKAVCAKGIAVEGSLTRCGTYCPRCGKFGVRRHGRIRRSHDLKRPFVQIAERASGKDLCHRRPSVGNRYRLWKSIVDPELLASRVDFSLGLVTGAYKSEPIQRIEARLGGLVNQAAVRYPAQASVRPLLDARPDPIRHQLDAALATDPALKEIGIAVTAVRLTNLASSSKLERALQTTTFEALQQKADQATFARRALAVEKERAIAENELANWTELARREMLLITQEAENARNRATVLGEFRRDATLAPPR